VQPAALDAPEVRRQAAVLDGLAEPPRAAAWDAAAVLPQGEAWDVAGALRLAAAWDAELLPVGPDARAGRPLAAPSVSRRGQLLLLPARRRVARSAHAMRNLPAASPSELTWQAARCEGLSWCSGPRKIVAAKRNRFRRTFRRIDQQIIIGPDCGGLRNAEAFYFNRAMPCARNYSLRVQTMAADRDAHKSLAHIVC
jgi:hypothetical protein